MKVQKSRRSPAKSMCQKIRRSRSNRSNRIPPVWPRAFLLAEDPPSRSCAAPFRAIVASVAVSVRFVWVLKYPSFPAPKRTSSIFISSRNRNRNRNRKAREFLFGVIIYWPALSFLRTAPYDEFAQWLPPAQDQHVGVQPGQRWSRRCRKRH